MSSKLDQSIFPTRVPTTPELVPVFVLNLKMAKEVEQVFKDSKNGKEMQLATLSNGEIKSVQNSFGLEFEVSGFQGVDEITINLDSGAGHLDCNVYGKTPNGSGVHLSYGGVILFLEPTVKVLGKETSTSKFEEGYVTCNPKFTFDDSVEEKYKWVLKENLIGKGRFVRDGEGSLYVQYYVYIIR